MAEQEEKRWTDAYITTVHTTTNGKTDLYSIRNKAGEAYAYNTLTVSALAIYLMVTSNKNGYPLTICSNSINGNPLPRGMSRRTYSRAMTELKENGFMVKDDKGDFWHFYDIPTIDVESIEKVVVEKAGT